MRVKLTSLAFCAVGSSTNNSVAFYQGGIVDSHTFFREVADKTQRLRQQPEKSYSLYYEESYPFTVMLFALLHAGKEIWIVANNKQTTAEKLIQQGNFLLGDWQGKETLLDDNVGNIPTLSPLDLKTTELVIFTSGSSGQAKAIRKSFWQLQCEIETLEQQWGSLLGQADALATVSHQHIYGLLFRVLWPLAAGRCSHSPMYLSPEPLLKATIDKPCYWISSPAQLKRLDELSPWNEVEKLKAIFSSGGCLTLDNARQIYQHSEQSVIEIYGSSETGGIAWRESINEPRWTLFDGISIEKIAVSENRSLLKSPYLPSSPPCFLDDKIELDNDGLFTLAGRLDRIVKVEEKRLSLDEMERAICRSNWIAEAYCLLWTSTRDWVMAGVVLTNEGKDHLKQQGRAVFIKKLRSQLMLSFETVVIPRKWLIMDSLPLTSQGKINHQIISSLLSLDNKKFPQIQSFHQNEQSVELSLRIQPELVYFNGHFPEQPILAGVVQLSWVEKYGKLFFSIEQPFLRMEVIKFKKIIQPKDIITLKLTWNFETGKLYFDFSSESEAHSSGRLLYGVDE